MGTGVVTALKIIHWPERPYYITVFRYHPWNQNVFTHLESSAAEEKVKDEERSHCEPAEITKCLSMVLYGCLGCIGAWGSSRDVWRIFRGVIKLLFMENDKN